MSIINKTPILNSSAYESVNTVSNNNEANDTEIGANQRTGNFSDVLSNKLREQALQSVMTRASGSTGMLGGIGGMNPMLGGANTMIGGIDGMGALNGGLTSAISPEMESTLIAAAGSGEMSGVQLLMFMMILMMQSSDSGSGDMAPVMQMLSGMLSRFSNDAAAGNLNNMIRLTDMEGETPVHLRRMVDTALEQVGYRERNANGSFGNGNVTKFGAWYGMDGQPWCAMFVSWAADQAGILDDTVPKHASTSRGVTAYQEKGLYASRQSGYLPREGDAIYFQSENGTIRHIGIVVGYNPKTQKVYTVEGNTDNAVRMRHYDLNSPYIHGYGQNGGTGFGRIPSNSTEGTGANNL